MDRNATSALPFLEAIRILPDGDEIQNIGEITDVGSSKYDEIHNVEEVEEEVYRISIYGILRIDTHIHSNVVIINIIIFKLSSNAPILKYLSLYTSSSLPLKTLLRYGTILP